MPLSGIKVLDLTSVVVGPAATLRLADLGAEIIKIEAPEGDLMRTLGGPSPSGTLSGKFLHFNRDKRFVCLNLRAPEGLKALRTIMQGCDVFITNLRPDSLARLGFDAAACRAAKPELIHCIITGFGPGGPYRGRPAYDTVLQAASGLAGLTIERDGAPSFAPFLAADHVVAEIAAGAIAAALVRRFRSRRGRDHRNPDARDHGGVRAAGASRARDLRSAARAARRPPRARSQCAADRDAGRMDRDHRQHRCAGEGFPARRRPRRSHRRSAVREVAARVKNSNDWYRLREELIASGTTAHWLKLFAELDIPAMPCHALGNIADDPHLTAVKLVERGVHPTEGPVKNVRPTLLFDGELGALRIACQAVGLRHAQGPGGGRLFRRRDRRTG